MSELDERIAVWQLRDADRLKRREEWDLLTAQRRAWISWRQARTVADRLGVLFETTFRSMKAVGAWRDIRTAAQRCLHLRVPGPNWRRELDRADERIAQLEPEWKRKERLDELKWREARRRPPP